MFPINDSIERAGEQTTENDKRIMQPPEIGLHQRKPFPGATEMVSKAMEFMTKFKEVDAWILFKQKGSFRSLFCCSI